MNKMVPQLATRSLQLLAFIITLSTLSACGNDSSTSTPISPDKETVTQTATPVPLQKLTLPPGGTLRAFIVIDNDRLNPIDMIIGNDDARTATVTIPGLSRASHNIVITYEYTDNNGTLTLAQFNTDVDLSGGNSNIDIDPTLYDFAFDDDGDNIDNATELLQGTDPRVSDLVAGGGFAIRAETDIPELNPTAQANGTLRGFFIIDNGARREITFTQGTPVASLDIPNLSQTIHDVVVIFTYTNNAGITYTLYEDSQKADLTLTGQNIIFNFNNLNTTNFDEDADGASNFDELLRNTDPLTRAIPFVAAQLSINTDQLGGIDFSWTDVVDATFYRILKSTAGTGPFTQVTPDITDGTQFESIAHTVTGPLFDHINDSYKLQSCNDLGCTDGETIVAVETFIGAIDKIDSPDNTPFNSVLFGDSIDLSADGKTIAVVDITVEVSISFDPIVFEPYINIFTNTNGNWTLRTRFRAPAVGSSIIGSVVSLSADGTTLAVAAEGDGNASQVIVNGSVPTYTSSGQYGAVYIYTRNNNNWDLQAYIKGSNIKNGGRFGGSISLSADGNTLAVGNPAPQDNSAYVFTRSNSTWSELTILTSSNLDPNNVDAFGATITLSNDGTTLAIGAPGERSQGTGVDNNIAGENPPSQTDNSAISSGAVYIFTKNSGVTPNTWSQQAYIKPSNTSTNDRFGQSNTISLSDDGNILAVASIKEDSDNRNDQSNDIATDSGAVYVFERLNNVWSQQDYIKADNIHPNAKFGTALDLSGDGKTLIIGAPKEKSTAIGYNGNQTNSEFESGAAYLFKRDINNKWNQNGYLKASISKQFHGFGSSASLSSDASTIAIGAFGSVYVY